jgi:hypothetical protein
LPSTCTWLQITAAGTQWLMQAQGVFEYAACRF